MAEPVDSGITSPDMLRTEVKMKVQRFEDGINRRLDNGKKSREKDPKYHERFSPHTYYVDEKGNEGSLIQNFINQVPEIDERISRASDGRIAWERREDRFRSPTLKPRITVKKIEITGDGDVKYTRREDEEIVEYTSSNPDHLDKINRTLGEALKLVG